MAAPATLDGSALLRCRRSTVYRRCDDSACGVEFCRHLHVFVHSINCFILRAYFVICTARLERCRFGMVCLFTIVLCSLRRVSTTWPRYTHGVLKLQPIQNDIWIPTATPGRLFIHANSAVALDLLRHELHDQLILVFHHLHLCADSSRPCLDRRGDFI